MGDVRYYLEGLEKEAAGERALVEYPDATVIPLRVIGWLTEGLDAFTVGVVVFCLLVDAALSAWLARRCTGDNNRRDAWFGFLFWILFGMLIGPVMIARLDLLPGVLVAGAAVWIGGRTPGSPRRFWAWSSRGAAVASGSASRGGPAPSSCWLG